jgi:hypothetical protein
MAHYLCMYFIINIGFNCFDYSINYIEQAIFVYFLIFHFVKNYLHQDQFIIIKEYAISEILKNHFSFLRIILKHYV